MIEDRDEGLEDLLAGLDDIDWAGLNHVYPSTEGVPGQLRQVRGGDEEAHGLLAGHATGAVISSAVSGNVRPADDLA